MQARKDVPQHAAEPTTASQQPQTEVPAGPLGGEALPERGWPLEAVLWFHRTPCEWCCTEARTIWIAICSWRQNERILRSRRTRAAPACSPCTGMSTTGLSTETGLTKEGNATWLSLIVVVVLTCGYDTVKHLIMVAVSPCGHGSRPCTWIQGTKKSTPHPSCQDRQLELVAAGTQRGPPTSMNCATSSTTHLSLHTTGMQQLSKKKKKRRAATVGTRLSPPRLHSRAAGPHNRDIGHRVHKPTIPSSLHCLDSRSETRTKSHRGRNAFS